MKISNETKIGALGILVIAVFIFGFNFLKGHQLFSKKLTLYAKYQNIQGLTASNPVLIKGMQVGIVSEITNDKDMKELIVVFSINKDIRIPSNSTAIINPNPLTLTKVEINLGDANTYLKNNDTIATIPSGAYLESVINKVDPVILAVKGAINSLDSLIIRVSNVIDANNKNNISDAIVNLNKITESVLNSTAALERIINDKDGSLSSSLKNVQTFTQSLADNNDKINNVLTNLDKTSNNLAQIDLQKTIGALDASIQTLKTTLSKLNSKEGSAGLFINDNALYNNLTATSNKLNILLDDVRMHPKRYVSVSVFGKKDKTGPLMAPLEDSIPPKTNP